MDILAYFFIGAAIMFTGGLFVSAKSRSKGNSDFSIMFVAFLAMLVSGFGLALGALGLLPTVIW